MMTNLDRYDLISQYQNLPDQVELVILHPAAYMAHPQLRQHLLNEKPVVYVKLPEQTRRTEDFLIAIFEAVATDLGVVVYEVPESLEETGLLLAEVLNSTPGTRLILDGCDGPAIPVLENLLTTTIPALGSNQRIIMIGRNLPYALIKRFSPDHRVALLPVDEPRMLLDYAKHANSENILEVRALGQGTAYVNGNLIEKWEGVLPRALFFYFIDKAMTRREEIFKTFWPNLSVQDATNVFHVTKRKISSLTGMKLMVFGGGFYHISPEINLHYDVANFREAVQRASVPDEPNAEELYQIAVDLYRDDFLSNLSHDWVIRRRDEMRRTYTEALIGLARINRARQDLPSALGFYQRASASAPVREDLVRDIMTLNNQLGYPERALEAYEDLKKRLKQSLGVSPDRQTEELAERIRNNR
jgi:DNA-binding SARP family transcriptional activator